MQIRDDSDAIGVRICGELDLSTLASFGHVLQQATEVGVNDVVVDLTEVAFLEVLTLNLICQTATELQRQGRRLRVRGLNAHQRRIWHLCGLDEMVTN